MKTILVTGCNGFVGGAFVRQYSPQYRIIGVDANPSENPFCEKVTADICDKEAMRDIFDRFPIDCVLHTAAEKSLAECERNPERAFRVNYRATADLASMAAQRGAKFIFISSDQVFDGQKALSRETDPPCAINQYGKLKIMAEEVLRGVTGSAVCRTALVFGDIPQTQTDSFDRIKYENHLIVQGYIVQHTRFALENRRPILLPDDEFVSPTHVLLLCEQLRTVIEKDISGVLHCCGKDRISRYEMGLRIAAHYNLSPDGIQSRGQPDPLRPKDVSLDCRATEKALEMDFPSFQQMLDKYM